MKRYAVNFQFYNNSEWIDDDLTNNGEGFTREEANFIAQQIRDRENTRDVEIVEVERSTQMKKNEIRVKDILDLMKDTDKVDCVFYAYGIRSCETWEDGFKTVGAVKNGMREDLFFAKVFDIHSGVDSNAENTSSMAVTVIRATLTKEV